jgi:glutathione synthase/RimK-type ligase-like ATP-grasp enzyme
VLDREPLFACRYYMARGHWQIVAEGPSGRRRFGRVEAVALEQAPAAVIEAALGAASLIGDGLYGVDVKEIDGRALVIEVNDNPNIEAGEEDDILGDALYLRVMQWFRKRLDARGWAP